MCLYVFLKILRDVGRIQRTNEMTNLEEVQQEMGTVFCSVTSSVEILGLCVYSHFSKIVHKLKDLYVI